MLFTIVTVLVLAAAVLGLAFHRFWTTRGEARSSLIYAEVAKRFFAWLALRTIQMARRSSPKAWWAFLRGLPLWRAPVLEKWLLALFSGSFLFLAASGFFFAVFVPRGLFGFPLVGHVMAGGLFAVGLTVVVLFKGRDFIAAPKPIRLTLELFDPRRMGLTATRVKRWSFWLFMAAGFLLTVSALLPMLPLLRTPGQKFMFEFHRYSAVLSALAATVFAGLQLFETSAGPADRGPEAPRT